MKWLTCILLIGLALQIHAQFSAKKTALYGLNNDISEMKTADFNADGHSDLLIGDHKHLSILYKLDHDGRYEVPWTLGDGYYFKFEVGDLDNDGDTDVIASDPDERLVRWINPGDGSFGSPVFVDDSIAGISEIVLDDFNGDAFLDIAVSASDGASASRGAFVYFNRQDGSFSDKLTLTVPFIGNHYYSSICTGDVDGDGLTDIITTRLSPFAMMVWFKNMGNETFSIERTITVASTSNLIATDIDGDDDIDFIFNSTIRIFAVLNNGDGTFAPIVMLYDGGVIYDIKIEDLDLDGDSDILATRVTTSSPWLLLMRNNGDGTFMNTSLATNEMETEKLHVGHINGDSLPDIMAVAHYEQRILYYLNQGGSFLPFKDAGHVHKPDEIVTGDIDNDGDEDLILGSSGGSFTASYLNSGTGTFRFGDFIHQSTTSQAVLDDIDADGDLDLLKSQFPFIDDTHTFPRLYFNAGDGRFPSMIQFSNPDGFANHAIPYDVNKDGLTDVAICRWYDDEDIYWRKNTGLGMFTSGGSYFNNGDFRPVHLAYADIDGDHDDDMVIAYASGAPLSAIRLYWFENTNVDMYKEHLIHAFSTTNIDIEIMDLNRDGYPDIWTCGRGTTMMSALNDGSGNFMIVENDFNLPAPPQNMLPGDYDFDGDTDIAVTSKTDHYFGWLENADSNGELFIPHMLAPFVEMADEMVFSDLDGDQKPDFVVITKDEILYFTNLYPAPPPLTVTDPMAICIDNGTSADPHDDIVVISFLVNEGVLNEIGDSAIVIIEGIQYVVAFGDEFMVSQPHDNFTEDTIHIHIRSLDVDSVFIEIALLHPGTCSTVDVEDLHSSTGGYVYPNPFKHDLTVSWDEACDACAITLFDIFGRTVYKQKLFSDASMVSFAPMLQSGLYLYQLTCDQTGRTLLTGTVLKQ